MEKNEQQMRQSLIDYCIEMDQRGLNKGTSGNASIRWQDGLFITPSGMAYDQLTVEDIVYIDDQGKAPANQRRPSSEWHFHHAILQSRPELNAVLHAHSPKATAVACMERELPPFHYMIAIAGGDSVRCAPYHTFGTPALAEAAVAALHNRRACLLAHHGIISAGHDIKSAFTVLQEIEHLCSIYLDIIAIEPIKNLTPSQIDEAIKKFASYGKQ
tara:strand:+ start:773 stop:1417 length:645 start_codon:yes stop_codon:yes gene_type:complete